MKKTLTALAAVVAMSCAGVSLAADYVTNYKEIVKQADWKNMLTVTVNIDEFDYDGDLNFKVGQPYKLELKNQGEKKHYFTAPEFYKSIATRKAQVNGQAEIKAPYFTALEILPGGQLDIYFVPTKRGEFATYCTIDDHRDEGMEDTIIVN